MLSFHNKPELKAELLARVDAHAKADRIIKGIYWHNGKGCAIGCMVEKNQNAHLALEKQYGIPHWLGRVIDRLFEGMPNENAMLFPYAFVNVLPIGIDLNQVKAPFLIYILESVLTKFDHGKFPDVKTSIDTVIALYKSNETDLSKFREAALAASTAADSAHPVATDAAYAADAANAAYAAYAYAYAAADAADAAYAYDAADAAADAADAAYAVAAAYAYADTNTLSNIYYNFSQKILGLIEECE